MENVDVHRLLNRLSSPSLYIRIAQETDPGGGKFPRNFRGIGIAGSFSMTDAEVRLTTSLSLVF